jgi:hypothetical protein
METKIMKPQTTITPTKITYQDLVKLRKREVKPIEGLNIPGITVPDELSGKIGPVKNSDGIAYHMRPVFNAVTVDNTQQMAKKLKEIVYAKVQNQEALNDAAEEIYQNFLINEMNIPNNMQLLNEIYSASIMLSNGKVSKSIGNYFLEKCCIGIFANVSEKKVRELALLDQDNPDDLDVYNREREKISNLIITICHLYGQRNTSFIKLTARQVIDVIKAILENHLKCQHRIKEIGNPFNGEECSDEVEFEILRKMCMIYAEQLYLFFSKKGKEFVADTTVFNEQVLGQILKDLVLRFQTEVVPFISEEFLKSKCAELKLM